jgi:hypothetical protein
MVPSKHQTTPAPEPRSTREPPPKPSPEEPGPDPATLPAPEEVVLAEAPVGEPPPAEPETGLLRVVVSPWARVRVDGEEVGTTPFGHPIELTAGAHVVSLTHPDYYTLKRRVTIDPGGSTELRLDLEWEGFKKP